MKRNEIILLVTLALAQFTNIMDFMIMMPLGPQFMRLFQITPQQFSTLVSSYTITAGISGFICSFFLDRFDRKNSFILTYAGFTIGTFACAISPSYSILMLARILTGVFGGILGAQVLAIVGDSFPYQRRAFAMSFVTASFSFASVFGVPFGLYLAAEFSWHTPFFAVAAFGIVIFSLIIIFVPNMKSHVVHVAGKDPFHVLTEIMKNRNQVLALLFMLMLILGQFTIIPFIAAYMVYNVGFTEHDLTYIYMLGGLATIIISPFLGKAADRYGKPLIFLISASLSIIPLYLITNMPRLPLPYVLTVTTVFFILISGRMTPAMTMITGTVLPQRRGSFMSIVSCVQMLSAGVASLISGAVVTQLPGKQLQHYTYAGYIAIASTLVAIYISRKLVVADVSHEVVNEAKIETLTE